MIKKAIFILIAFVLILSAEVSFSEANAEDSSITVEPTYESFPKIGIYGYKKYIFYELSVSPTKNYNQAAYDLSFPAGGPWQERLRLGIIGTLSKDLSIWYLLKQNPSGAETYEVNLNYLNHELILGDLGYVMPDQEYLLQDKLVGGIGYRGTFDKLKLLLLWAGYPKAISERDSPYSSRKQFTLPDYGGDEVPFRDYKDNPEYEIRGIDLPSLNIDEDTIFVAFDGERRLMNQDYRVDLRTKSILFLEDLNNYKKIFVSYKTLEGNLITGEYDAIEDTKRKGFLISDNRVFNGSEIVTVDGARFERDIDYTVDYNSAILLFKKPIHDTSTVKIDYDYVYGSNYYTTMTLSNVSGSTFSLRPNIISGSEMVVKNGTTLVKGVDYTIDCFNGTITFTLALIVSDVVDISFSYAGIRYDSVGFSGEYRIDERNKIGLSYLSFYPYEKDKNIFNLYSPKAYQLVSISNRYIVNDFTLVNAEFTQSYLKNDTGASETSADNAYKLGILSRIMAADLSVTYRGAGKDFASINYIHDNISKEVNEMSLNVDFNLDNSVLQIGGSSGKNISNAAADTSSTSIIVGYAFLSGSFPFDVRISNMSENISGMNRSADSSSFLGRLNLDLLMSPIKNNFKNYDLYLKYSVVMTKNEIQDYFISSDTSSTNYELGWLAEYDSGLSTFVKYTSVGTKDNQTGSDTDKNAPFIRIAYKWGFGGGHFLKIYTDHETATQTSNWIDPNFTSTTRGFGAIYELPLDNIIISKFNIGMDLKQTDYKDNINNYKNYTAHQLSLIGSLVF